MSHRSRARLRTAGLAGAAVDSSLATSFYVDDTSLTTA
jgi:hypothetical protein